MVAFLTRAEKTAIAEAIREAESRCSPEIIAVVTPACDAYYSYAVLYGLLLGSLIDIAIWAATGVGHEAPLYLLIQLASMALCVEIPLLRRAIACLAPSPVKHARARRQALTEYALIARQLPPEAPFVLLFAALAERYVHLLPSPHLAAALPDAAVQDIALAMAESGKAGSIAPGITDAVRALGGKLAAAFPASGKPHHFSDEVVESEEPRES